MERLLRKYVCHVCGKTEVALAAPKGWVSITMKSDEYEATGQAFGFVCSRNCLKQRVISLVTFSGMEQRDAN